MRVGLMRILCSNKGETEVGSLAMACRPEWPADYFRFSKTDRGRSRPDRVSSSRIELDVAGHPSRTSKSSYQLSGPDT